MQTDNSYFKYKFAPANFLYKFSQYMQEDNSNAKFFLKIIWQIILIKFVISLGLGICNTLAVHVGSSRFYWHFPHNVCLSILIHTWYCNFFHSCWIMSQQRSCNMRAVLPVSISENFWLGHTNLTKPQIYFSFMHQHENPISFQKYWILNSPITNQMLINVSYSFVWNHLLSPIRSLESAHLLNCFY